MSWYEKHKPTPFDSETPIRGLHYIDGDVLARKINLPWTQGQKYPRVEFPSGEAFDLWEGGDGPILHIFGEMDLPLKSSRDQAWEIANGIAEQVGYAVEKVGNAGLVVIGRDDHEHFMLVYDPENAQVRDVIKLEPAQEKPIHPAHQLLTDAIREPLPPLYSNEEKGLDAIAQVKYFLPGSGWTWYASEGSPVDEDGYFDTDKEKVDFIFFGLVSGFEVELGTFSLSQLQSARSRLGLPVERDLYYEPKTLRELRKLHDRGDIG